MNENTLYKTLYKLNTNGSTQVWEIHRNHNSYWSVSGQLNGKMIVNEPTLVEPKQKRTLEEQVVFVCESQISKKRDKKYVENIADIHTADDDLLGFTCTLAKKYEDHQTKLKGKRLSISRKLDGVRCISGVFGIVSRGRKRFTSCPHIQKELEDFFTKDPTAQLDGELYTDQYKADFEKICSAVKKTAEHATPEDIELQKKVEYWVFDARRIGSLNENDSFESRFALLEERLKECNYKYIKVVPTTHGVDQTKLVEMRNKFMAEGYEGLMVRVSGAPYEEKRTDKLLKMKLFEDAEFVITGVQEGNGKLAGHVGAFILKTEDGKEFKAKLDGNMDRLKYLFDHPEEYMNKMATVKFQGTTVENVPRFPVMKAIRGLEDRSDWV